MDVKRLCEGYTKDTYDMMAGDVARTEAYAAALKSVVAGRVCVDIGTGALALLALFCARFGAKHVYAIEASAKAAAEARAVVASKGFADRITIIQGYSTEVKLPEKADVVVHEIFGELLTMEGVASVLRDAQSRYLLPNHLSVPSRGASLIAPSEFPPQSYWTKLPFPLIVDSRANSLKLEDFPQDAALAVSQTCETLDFSKPIPTRQETTRTFEITRRGVFRGFVAHITLSFDTTKTVVDSWDEKSHWPSLFILFPEKEVKAADRVRVTVGSDWSQLNPRYSFAAELETGGEWEPLGKVQLPNV